MDVYQRDNVIELCAWKDRKGRTYSDAFLEQHGFHYTNVPGGAISKKLEITPRIAPPSVDNLFVEQHVHGPEMMQTICGRSIDTLHSSIVYVWRMGLRESIPFDHCVDRVNDWNLKPSTVDDLFGLAYLLEKEDVFILGTRILALGSIVFDEDGKGFCPCFEKNEKNKEYGLYLHYPVKIQPSDILLVRHRSG